MLFCYYINQRGIRIWIREKSPDWDLTMDLGNIDLALLTAYKLSVIWNAQMRIITVVDTSEKHEAKRYLDNLLDAARLKGVSTHVEVGTFEEALRAVPQADLDLFGLSGDPDLDKLRSSVKLTGSSCVFVSDSGNENVLA